MESLQVGDRIAVYHDGVRILDRYGKDMRVVQIKRADGRVEMAADYFKRWANVTEG